MGSEATKNTCVLQSMYVYMYVQGCDEFVYKKHLCIAEYVCMYVCTGMWWICLKNMAHNDGIWCHKNPCVYAEYVYLRTKTQLVQFSVFLRVSECLCVCIRSCYTCVCIQVCYRPWGQSTTYTIHHTLWSTCIGEGREGLPSNPRLRPARYWNNVRLRCVCVCVCVCLYIQVRRWCTGEECKRICLHTSSDFGTACVSAIAMCLHALLITVITAMQDVCMAQFGWSLLTWHLIV